MVSALSFVQEKGISNTRFHKYWQGHASTDFNLECIFITDERLKKALVSSLH